MSVPLKDLGRFGVRESTHMWLESESAAFGKTIGDIAREVLDEWAKKKAHAFKVAHRRMSNNGLQADWLGDDAEDDGRSRRDR